MKLTLAPEGLRERIFFALGRFPRLPMLSLMGTELSQIIVTGVRLNIFEHLREGPKTAAEVGALIDCDDYGMEILLDCMSGFGLLRRAQGEYSLEPETRDWLTRNGKSPGSVESIWLNGEIGRRFHHLDEYLKTGRVNNVHFDSGKNGWWGSYLKALKAAGPMSAPLLIKRLNLERPPRRMLDIGGGPGLMSIAFCKQFPELTSTIMELPNLVEHGKSYIREAGMQDRISYIPGDVFENDMGKGYDLALMVNFIHAINEEQCRLIVRRTYDALAPGGMLVIQDNYYPGPDEEIPLMSGFASLMYFVTTGSRAWPSASVRAWGEEAGFSKVTLEARNRKGLLATAIK
jgi:SAM-dependent methyltransferase